MLLSPLRIILNWGILVLYPGGNISIETAQPGLDKAALVEVYHVGEQTERRKPARTIRDAGT